MHLLEELPDEEFITDEEYPHEEDVDVEVDESSGTDKKNVSSTLDKFIETIKKGFNISDNTPILIVVEPAGRDYCNGRELIDDWYSIRTCIERFSIKTCNSGCVRVYIYYYKNGKWVPLDLELLFNTDIGEKVLQLFSNEGRAFGVLAPAWDLSIGGDDIIYPTAGEAEGEGVYPCSVLGLYLTDINVLRRIFGEDYLTLDELENKSKLSITVEPSQSGGVRIRFSAMRENGEVEPIEIVESENIAPIVYLYMLGIFSKSGIEHFLSNLYSLQTARAIFFGEENKLYREVTSEVKRKLEREYSSEIEKIINAIRDTLRNATSAFRTLSKYEELLKNYTMSEEV